MTLTTSPVGLNVAVTYNGSSTAPTVAGSYSVVATIVDPNYQGFTTGTLTISSAASLVFSVPGTAGGTVNYKVTGGPAAALGSPPVDTGLFLEAGDAVTINATGTVSWFNAGASPPDGGLIGCQDVFLAPCPTPGISLIARIGTGAWQFVGSGPITLTAGNAGFLELAVNDSYYGDNGGSFEVHVSFSGGIDDLVGVWRAEGSALDTASGNDGSLFKTYVNGVLRHTHSGSGGTIASPGYSNEFRIGGRQYSDWTGGGTYRQDFQGKIDEVVVSDRAFSSAEVSQLAGEGPLVVTPPAGGTGGCPFGQIDCPAGSVATGFTGSYSTGWAPVGAAVVTEVWCSPLSGGVVSGAASFAGVAGAPIAGVDTDYGSVLTCPVGKVITGISGAALPFGASTVVGNLGVTCSDPDGTAPVTLGPVYGVGAPLMSCPAGQTVVGIQGRQGSFLDQVALRCK